MIDDDRPYWERYYGIVRGPLNRRAWLRLVVALLVALVIVVLVVMVGALLTG